jgi:hypothetical protein
VLVASAVFVGAGVVVTVASTVAVVVAVVLMVGQ